jgi:polar amino acid transport system substrate-binding protein
VKARLLPVVLLVVTIAAGITGCGSGAPEDGPALTPLVEPPVIAEEGVLRVGVDMAYPPFAATVDGATVGIDVDVAAAVAERLGLHLELMDVKPADMTAALDSGEIDVMLGAVPITDAVLANVTTAGSYIVDGPAFFARSSGETSASVVATVTPEQLPAMRVGAQASSEAFWELENEYGEGFVQSFDTLKDAIVALEAGELDVVAGDAVVGAYIARDHPGAGFAGQFGEAQPLGVSVRKDAVELEAAVRTALDGMAADGVLETIRRKWLGDVPALTVSVEGATN